MRWLLILATLTFIGCASTASKPKLVLTCGGEAVADTTLEPGIVTLLAPECEDPGAEVR
jgi:hypothetical protein